MKNFIEGARVSYLGNLHKGIEEGVLKSKAGEGSWFVVFNCAGDWENYKDYTGVKCDEDRMVVGWESAGDWRLGDTVASDMQRGLCCAHCGQYFKVKGQEMKDGIFKGIAHGFSVYCCDYRDSQGDWVIGCWEEGDNMPKQRDFVELI